MKTRKSLIALAILAPLSFVIINTPALIATAEGNPDAVSAEIIVDADGVSYGTASVFDYGEEPDFIKAIATNGKEGYVKKSDLLNAETQASTPEEAVEIAKSRDEELLSAFSDKLAKLSGNQEIDKSIAHEILLTKLSASTSSSAKTSADGIIIGGELLTDSQIDQAVYESMMTVSTSIPVYADDGVTVIGEFLIG